MVLEVLVTGSRRRCRGKMHVVKKPVVRFVDCLRRGARLLGLRRLYRTSEQHVVVASGFEALRPVVLPASRL